MEGANLRAAIQSLLPMCSAEQQAFLSTFAHVDDATLLTMVKGYLSQININEIRTSIDQAFPHMDAAQRSEMEGKARLAYNFLMTNQ